MLASLFRRGEVRQGNPGAMSWPDYERLWERFGYNGVEYMVPTGGMAQVTALQSIRNPIVLACIGIRAAAFSEIRFAFQQLSGGRAARDLFGNQALAILEHPWPGASTGDLLGRMEVDASMYGNSYWWRSAPDTLTWIDPTRIKILTADTLGPSGAVVGKTLLGYQTVNRTGQPDESFLADEIVHFRPLADPLHPFRGLSWMSALLQDVTVDQDMVNFKHSAYRNGIMANLVATLPEDVSADSFAAFREKLESRHVGPLNAFKTLYLSAGTDVKTMGVNWSDLEFYGTESYQEDLALDTPIPTPEGWTTMGAIQPGAHAFGRDGQPVRVLGASPVTERSCYRMSFSDGTAIVASDRHLWTVIDSDNYVERILSTEQLQAEMLAFEQRPSGGTHGWRFRIPAGAPVQLPEADLLLDPYLLGAWLGDGDSAGAAICGATDDLSSIVGEIRRRGYTVRPRKPYPGKVPVVGVHDVKVILRELGVLGDKHIPAVYLRASYRQRLALFRGLMDTDGCAGLGPGRAQCDFSSKFERLARQTAELARSLGYRVKLYRYAEPRSRTGEMWSIRFRADPDLVPFLLPRKVATYQAVTPIKVRNRSIVSIEPVPARPVRCIAVDSPDHLFRAGEGWTLTHNTRLCAAAGVPATMVGIAEGLKGSALNAGNYTATRRRFADLTIRPQWRMACAALETVAPPLPGSRLWYDDRDILFLQADLQDAATSRQADANTILQLVNSGYTPDSVVLAVTTGDLSNLKHTGLFSIQLQPPGELGEPGGPATVPALPPTNGKGKTKPVTQPVT